MMILNFIRKNEYYIRLVVFYKHGTRSSNG